MFEFDVGNVKFLNDHFKKKTISKISLVEKIAHGCYIYSSRPNEVLHEAGFL